MSLHGDPPQSTQRAVRPPPTEANESAPSHRAAPTSARESKRDAGRPPLDPTSHPRWRAMQVGRTRAIQSDR
eukprot:616062-Prymnesium_polylepis.1